MRRTAAALAAVAVLFVAGCSASGDDAPDDSPDPSSSRKVSGLRGITLPSWNTDDYAGPQAGTYLRQIADTGARWVTFTPTWYQDTVTDAAMRTTDETASDASLRHIIRLAHDAGLKTMLKPHVDLTKGGDRAEIHPGDTDAWFTAYERFITHYAQLAADAGVEQFAVGTELAGTSGDGAHWSRVVAAVRERYKGTLTYAANYDEYRKVAFWKDLDLVGIDAYWPLGDKPTTDTARLRQAWQPIVDELAAFSARTKRKILFTEAGYVSQRGSTTAPYSWSVSKRDGDAEQAAGYEALLATFDGKPWWAGVCWWMWDDWPDSGETAKKLAYTPHGKPAEKVLRRWWSRG
ncbi:glycoside hydrolase TIM-barrel-like domain-containing protein [Streptomyces sp. NPDC049585]|uniref:glycoside hydrolase family 113 n=1 Tax=Streptomyces sp. NPDC049585 TaxID=3155154 RepID=UPI0034439B39